MLSPALSIILITVYALVMLGITKFSKSKQQDLNDYLVMSREVGTWRGAFSIAASWIWAPAVFICAQKAFEQGLPGIFWFTAPNILCFFVFVPIALRVRQLMPAGYSMPDYLYERFNKSKSVHLTALFVYLGYQLGAIIINALAGGLLLNTLTGLPVSLCTILMATAAFSYSIISGLRASVITDVVQMALILVIAFVIVPWVLIKTGLTPLSQGLSGVSGDFGNIFDPMVAYSFGIAATISLISGPVADQMFFQRAFAAKPNKIAGIFMLGGLTFGIVPIVLSVLGFVAAGLVKDGSLVVDNVQMVGPILVSKFLPYGALAGFVVLAFAGLSSTLDSAFAAVSSLCAVDVYKKHINPNAADVDMLRVAKLGMIVFALLGTAIALLQPKLLWMFLIYGALAAVMIVPVFFSLFSERIGKKGVLWAMLLSLVVGLPLSIYANITEQANLIVISAIVPIAIGLLCCLVSVVTNKSNYHFKPILVNQTIG